MRRETNREADTDREGSNLRLQGSLTGIQTGDNEQEANEQQDTTMGRGMIENGQSRYLRSEFRE